MQLFLLIAVLIALSRCDGDLPDPTSYTYESWYKGANIAMIYNEWVDIGTFSIMNWRDTQVQAWIAFKNGPEFVDFQVLKDTGKMYRVVQTFLNVSTLLSARASYPAFTCEESCGQTIGGVTSQTGFKWQVRNAYAFNKTTYIATEVRMLFSDFSQPAGIIEQVIVFGLSILSGLLLFLLIAICIFYYRKRNTYKEIQ